MKILLLNPHIDAEHRVAKSFRDAGIVLLLSSDAVEAWQILRFHGQSVALAVVHREFADGQGEPGLEFVIKCKKDELQQTLPIVITSSVWGEAEYDSHQKGTTGANGYLKYPFEASSLLQLIECIVGANVFSLPVSQPVKPELSEPATLQLVNLAQESVGGDGTIALSIQSQNPETQAMSSQGIVVEDAAAMFGSFEGIGTIQLEAHSETYLPNSPFQLGSADHAEIVASGASGEGAAVLFPPAPPPGLTQMISVPTRTGTAPPPVLESLEPHFEMPSISVTSESNSPFQERGDSPLFFSDAISPADELDLADDSEVAQEMPYLFESSAEAGSDYSEYSSQSEVLAGLGVPQVLNFSQPIGDSVVPGGAAQAPDLETLKKYLLLREQDVAALSTQLKSARDQVSSVEGVLRQERARNVELGHVVEEQKRKLDDFDRDKKMALEGLSSEIDELKFHTKVKVDKARLLEAQVREATDEMERLKERVRSDIRKIRVREKELENRLEIMKKDSEALIGARETKIIELKRKLDLLEFNMDLLQDQYTREKETSRKFRERLAKALQAVRVAGGLLDNNSSLADSNNDDVNQAHDGKDEKESAAS